MCRHVSIFICGYMQISQVSIGYHSSEAVYLILYDGLSLGWGRGGGDWESLTRLGELMTLRDAPVSSSPVIGSQAHITTPGFLCGCL